MVDKPNNKATEMFSAARLWSLVSELGFKIAIPLVVFLLLGVTIDRSLGTQPLFMLTGIVLALASSVYLVYRIIRQVSEGQA